MNRRLIVLLAIAAAVLLAITLRAALLRAAIGIAAAGAGYSVSYGDLHLRGDGFDVTDLRVRVKADPLVDVRHAAIGVHWPGIFGGARTLYGLTSVDLAQPSVTIVRDADGSWNLPLHRGGAAPAAAAPALDVKLNAAVHDGEITIVDAFHGARHPVAHVRGINGRAAIDTSAQSDYSLAAQVDGGSALRVRGFARARNAVARAHVEAANLPIARAISIVVDPSSARFASGSVRDLDAYVYSHKGGPYHLTGTARVEDVALSIRALLQPIHVHGAVSLIDGGFTGRALAGSIAGIPLQAAGAIYGIPDQPSFALGARGAGSLAQAKSIFAFSRRLPIAGTATLGVSLGGAIADPVVLVRAASPRATYANAHLDDVRAAIGYYGESVTVVSANAASESLALDAHAGLDTSGGGQGAIAVAARGDAAVVPYLGHIVGTGRLFGNAVAFGPVDALAGGGSVAATGTHGAIAAAPVRFSLAGDVNAPVFATQPGGGSLTGLVHRDRSGELAIWADARNYRLEGSRAIDLGDSGKIAGQATATVALAGRPPNLELVGRATATEAQIGTLHLGSAQVALSGTPRGTRFDGLSGSGPFGHFTGRGELVGSKLALEGRYDGSFEAIAALTGDLGGRGPLHGPVRIAISPAGTTVQSRGLDASGATVRGVPLGEVAGTVALSGGTVAVPQAVGRVAGGNAVVSGPLDQLHVVATNLDARSLRAAGLPLDEGRLALAGTASVAKGGTGFDGSAVIKGGRFRGLPVSGSTTLALHGADAGFSAAGVVAGASSRASGRASLAAGGPFGVTLGTLGLPASVLRTAGAKLPAELSAPADFEGTVGGAGKQLTVHGRVSVPVGFYGALPFTGAHASIDAVPGAATLRDGGVAVGSTRIDFDGDADLRTNRLAANVRAPKLDLGDFDLYFARAGTLAGTGSVGASLVRDGTAWQTTGSIGVRDATIGRPAGDVALVWRMRDSKTIGGDASLLAEGNGVRSEFRITPSGDAPLLSPLDGALVSATIRARDDNLLRDATLVIPPGFPSLSGRLTASGVLEGRYPNLTFAGTGIMREGALGRFAFQQVSLSVSADRRGATVTDAQIHVPGATANGSGYVRFGRDPVANFRAAAEVPQVHDVLTTLANRPIPLFGELQASAKLTGTFSKPVIEGAAFMPGGTFSGVTIQRAIASFGISGSDVELRDATITFPKGGVQLAGTLPFRLKPFRIGPRSAAVGFDLAAVNLDLSDFTPLLPEGSHLTGVINGRVGVNGTVRNPSLYGSLNLAGGSVVSPAFLSDPITAIGGTMTFAGRGFTLDRLTAKAGPGDLNAAATAEVRDDQIASRVQLRADHALLGVPAIGRGVVDADLGFEKLPGEIAALTGTVALSDATVPFSALYAGSAGPGGVTLPPLALDVKATVGKNVRVRSANVDIGGTGTIALDGTIADPKLDGTLTSTGGTITFGNRAFRLQEGTVAFTPDSGFDPEVTATATTRVPNSDPDSARNPTGSATVNLTVTGSLSNPTTTLTSDPSYSKDQILGLLLGVPALGASLFSDSTPGVPGSRQYATNGSFVGQEALGVVNAQFTRLLLAPFETQISDALGLSSVDINIGGTSAVGVSARKVLGKDISAIYSSSFIYPFQQSFGFELRARRYTSAQFVYYQTLAPVLLSSCSLVSPFENQGSAVVANASTCSTQGFNLSIKQYFPPP